MRRLSLIAALLSTAALAACGNGNSDTNTSINAKAPELGPPAPMADAFTAQVKTVAAALPEEAEPANIDALAATEPENREPVAL